MDEIETLFGVIEPVINKEGYTVLDGDENSVIIKNKNSGKEYIIRITEI